MKFGLENKIPKLKQIVNNHFITFLSNFPNENLKEDDWNENISLEDHNMLTIKG